MKKLLLALAVLFPGLAKADVTDPRMGLVEPSTGSLNWGGKLNSNFRTIDSSAAVQGKTNTFTASNTFTGSLLLVNTGFTLTGGAGFITSQSSITALTYFGDGSNLTNINTGNLSGVVPIANGGTNASASTQALVNLNAAKRDGNDDITSMSSVTAISSALTMSSTLTINGINASGYSIGTASGIFINAGGIRFADNTLQFTASVSSSAAAQLNQSNAFTGQVNSFAGKTLISSNTSNVEIRLASGTFLNVSSITLFLNNYGVQVASTNFELRYVCRSTASVFFNVIFNGDTGTNYSYSTQQFTSGGGASGDGGTAEHAISLCGGTLSGAPARSRGRVRFSTGFGGAVTSAEVDGTGKCASTGNADRPGVVGGVYNGASTISRIDLLTSSVATGVAAAPNKFSVFGCYIELWASNTWQ